MSSPFLAARLDPLVVAASLLIACFASYVALDLARRVRHEDTRIGACWWAGGSVAMGTGIWSMHFVGMLAYTLPIPLGYGRLLTFVSWCAAVAVSAVALGCAARGSLTRGRWALGALLMAGGICTMHYTGMAALDIAPGIVWNGWLVAASVLVALAASAAALGLFFWMRAAGPHRMWRQAGAALLMGAAISGMHYTAMAAVNVPAGSVCLSAAGLGGAGLGLLVALASVATLGMTLFTSVLDAHMQGRTALLAGSLRQANEELQSAYAELEKRALLDPLTGLANRALFEERLREAAGRGERMPMAERPCVGVLFIDLDGFKPVNDSYGHATGDRVLAQAAQRLRQAARAGDTVARVGGDEFLMLLEDLPSLAEAVSAALRLVEALKQPFDAEGRALEISASIGVAVCPDHGTADRLVTHADAAMYAAKRAGGGRHAVYESPRGDAGPDALSLQGELRHAVERGQLALHYQPKVDARRGRICGAEALLRWTHPQLGPVGPGVFVPIAERFGLIVELGEWVIDEACRQIRAWGDAGARLRVAINLSAHQMQHDGLVDSIVRALERHGVEASQLLCEITESVVMTDGRAVRRNVDGLQRIGVFLSIDDFGTGYSSLGRLRQMPAQQLKIDRSFVRDIESSADARAVVDAVIHLAHALGLHVVAEGVETAGQRDVLVRLGCDELQGYFFARPMPADDLTAWMRGGKPHGAVDFAPSVVAELEA